MAAALHHEVHGCDGPDLVLLHGVGLDRTMWARCLPALAERHRVTLVDLRGHGDSPRAEAGVSLAELAADVAELLTGPTHLVGFSLGALVAQRLAVVRPESTATLTLVSSVAGRTEAERTAVARRRERARSDFEASARAAVDRWFSPEWRAAEPELPGRVLATLLANDRTSYLACYDVFATADAGLWPLLPDIAARTLAVTGADDPGSTPEMTRRLAARIPDVSTCVLPEARHLLPLERPAELTELILGHTAPPAPLQGPWGTPGREPGKEPREQPPTTRSRGATA
ncbi:alpha/beta fold hydrolase [Streptomyces humi]|uniref:alpha/beta fold hydrolase n=1 Tax=Streptomyces humi TaxID=1428620 RepID=UPI0009A0D2D9|nr:alpha/beta fold hydrolase [Streptomyces humi]